MNRYLWTRYGVEFSYMIDYNFCFIPEGQKYIYEWMSYIQLDEFFEKSIAKKFKKYILLPPKIEDRYQRDLT